jgi:hypothetical protein
MRFVSGCWVWSLGMGGWTVEPVGGKKILYHGVLFCLFGLPLALFFDSMELYLCIYLF